MQPSQASHTAAIMAAFRAAETARPASRRLFSDPYARVFSPRGLRAISRAAGLPLAGRLVTKFIDWRWPGARSSAIARTRLIDDWIALATADGVNQFVVLGAGFDSRAWRLACLAEMRTFEVDHPATSAAKETRLRQMGASRGSVTFVRVDFQSQDFVQALRAANRRSLVLWEGVSQYLDAAAVERVFAWAGTLPAGSRLIFTYVDAGVIDGTADYFGAAAILSAVRKSHEAWTWGARPAELQAMLARHNLTMRADLGAADYRRLVMGEKAKSLRGYEFYRAVCAEVSGAEAHA